MSLMRRIDATDIPMGFSAKAFTAAVYQTMTHGSNDDYHLSPDWSEIPAPQVSAPPVAIPEPADASAPSSWRSPLGRD